MRSLFSALLITFFIAPTMAQSHGHGDDTAKAIRLTDTISMIQAGGGNIGVSSGEDGLFIIDTGLAEGRKNVLSAIKSIAEKPVRVLINTHWHYDHVGNNEGFQENGTIIMAHDNVRKRMKAGQRIEAFDKTVPPAAHTALPVVTYDLGSHVHLNGETAQIFSVDPAHTDGDSFVYWKDSNVIHSGDLFFNGFWPFIDASSGGNIEGMIKAAYEMLNLADDQTKIIPGHGPLATKADLQNYYDTLKIVEQRVNTAKEAAKAPKNGEKSTEKSVQDWMENWIAEKPLKDLEKEWGDGFLPTDKFIKIVWDGV